MSDKKSKMKHKKLKITLIVVGAILVVLIGAGVFAFQYYLGGLQTTEIDKTNEELAVDEEVSEEGITNIALFGLDEGVVNQDPGIRSDAIIVMTLDENASKIKLTSILRDTKLPIEGFGETNLNEAYNKGGVALAIKTLNQNFDLDITDYISVNFTQLAGLIDSVGGVTVTIKPEEVAYVNSGIKAYFPDEPKLKSSGEVNLTGAQAVSYSRIRKLGSDVARVERQQHVMDALLAKIKDLPTSSYPDFVKEFLAIAETSLGYDDLLGYSSFAIKGFTMEDNTIPLVEYETDLWGGIDDNGSWVWKYDLDNATKRLHHIIWNTPYEDPTSSENTADVAE